jgi:hypothetical protein
MTRRLLPEVVQESYTKTGLRPVMGTFFDYDGQDGDRGVGPCGCAFGAYVAADAGEAVAATLGGAWFGAERYLVRQGFTTDYVLGYMHAFDGGLPRPRMMADWALGYRDGSAAAELVSPTDDSPSGE